MNKEYVAAYRHRTIRRFKLGPFIFENHILTLKAEKENEDFLDLLALSPNPVRSAIVEVLNLENERRPQLHRAIRGATATSKIPNVQDRHIEGQDETEPSAGEEEGKAESPSEPVAQNTQVPQGISLLKDTGTQEPATGLRLK